MSSTATFFVIFMLVSFLIFSTTAHLHPCSERFLEITRKKNLTGGPEPEGCRRLTTLGAEFGWKMKQEHQIDIIFGVRLLYEDQGWIAWGINPSKEPQMVGTRAIIGIRVLNGATFTKTYNITRDTKLGCKLEPTKFEEAQNEVIFQNMTMYFIGELEYYAIQARVVLPATGTYNISRLNHVWQVGYELDGMDPKNHPTILQNVDSTETTNLNTGKGRHVGKHENYLRMVHGILSIVGWGTFLPAGVIVTRYFKYPLEFSEDWQFHLHVFCQITGYLLGTSGWIVGLYLGNLSKFYIFRTHRLYAMFIFAFTTLQMLAIQLRPKEHDEYRKYWNMYHHFLGYALLVVISRNIFHGIGILKPNENTWKWAYIGILIAFGAIVIAFEIYTWIKFKNDSKPSTTQQGPESQDKQGQDKGRIAPQGQDQGSTSTSPTVPKPGP